MQDTKQHHTSLEIDYTDWGSSKCTLIAVEFTFGGIMPQWGHFPLRIPENNKLFVDEITGAIRGGVIIYIYMFVGAINKSNSISSEFLS